MRIPTIGDLLAVLSFDDPVFHCAVHTEHTQGCEACYKIGTDAVRGAGNTEPHDSVPE